MVFRNGAHPMPDAPAAGEAILFLGTWLSRKGTAVLAEAARRVHTRGMRPHWVLGGVGVEKERVLREWPPELHEHTEIVPHFAGREEAGLFARCSLFVLPSFFEGQPLSLLQAMAAGRCCLASACCGQRDLIRHRHSGLLHTPGDAAGLAAQLEECLRDSALRARLGAAARETVRTRAWPQVAGEVVSFVEAMAGLSDAGLAARGKQR
jgi:glycosyltransferase involved in cell wall biosynthesis